MQNSIESILSRLKVPETKKPPSMQELIAELAQEYPDRKDVTTFLYLLEMHIVKTIQTLNIQVGLELLRSFYQKNPEEIEVCTKIIVANLKFVDKEGIEEYLKDILQV